MRIFREVMIILSILFLYSCDGLRIVDPSHLSGSCENCFLEVDIPDLQMDENGYYHLDFDDGSLQTFIQLRAYVGHEMEYVEWMTNTNCAYNLPVVGSTSYSDKDGYVYSMLGVCETNIGDTVTIWVAYFDDSGTQWLESIKVIII